jgi:MFS family permease
MAPDERTRSTFRRERWRAVCSGIIETAGNTFLLLIATRHFNAGPVAKSLVAAGGSVGLLLTPLVVNHVQRIGARPSAAASRALTIGAILLLVAALAPAAWGPLYAVACVVAMAMPFSIIPLMTQVYQDNYPAAQRGRLFSLTVMLRIGAAILFAAIAGWWLDPVLPTFIPDAFAPGIDLLVHQPGRERALVVFFALTFAAAAWTLSGIPSSPLAAAAGSHPLHAWRYVRSDRLFRQALIAWMLMGFANLAMLPLRVEYLGNPRYGLSKSAGEIALLTLIIPNVARLIISPVWGWLFDRMNFFVLRITLNLGFALGIAAFFTSNTPAGLVWGSIIYGISNAGGDVAWSLWVTKFAPAGRVADYMSIHTFLTGVRGVIAPFAAFQFIQHYTPSTLGWYAGGLILIATLILLPEIRSIPAKA